MGRKHKYTVLLIICVIRMTMILIVQHHETNIRKPNCTEYSCELENSEMYCYVALFLKLWLDESKT